MRGHHRIDEIGALCEAHHIDLSGSLRALTASPRRLCPAALASSGMVSRSRRIEQMLFEGAPVATAGVIRPDLSRPGHGLAFKAQDAQRFALVRVR